MTHRQALLFLGIATWLVGACGLPTSGVGGESTASSSSVGSGNGGAGGAPATSSTTSAGTTTASSSSQSAGGGGTGGAPSATTSATSSAETTGAGGAPGCTGPGGVCCGGVFCDLDTSKCCAQQSNMSASCIPRGVACSPTEIDMECDDKTDCAGGLECCATWSGVSWTKVACEAPCNPPDSGGPTPGGYPQCIVGTQCTAPLVCLPDLSNFGPPHGYCNPF